MKEFMKDFGMKELNKAEEDNDTSMDQFMKEIGSIISEKETA